MGRFPPCGNSGVSLLWSCDHAISWSTNQSSSFNGQMGRMRIEMYIHSVIWKQHTPFLPLHCQEWVILFPLCTKKLSINILWASDSHGNSTLLKVKVKVTQLCPTLCDPMDYTVHGILQARILEWVAFSFSRGSSQPKDQTQVSLFRWIERGAEIFDEPGSHFWCSSITESFQNIN